MDDLSAILSSVLEDPEAMDRLMQTASQLFGGGEKQEEQHNETFKEEKEQPRSSLPLGDFLPIITKIAPLLRSVEGDDDNVRLLHALRPFLGEERKKRMDEAEKIMLILRLLPALRGQNIL